MAGIFPITLTWTGNTLDEAYSRSGDTAKPGGQAAIPVSSTQAFGGDPSRWNPEELLASALATCHMLTFLALAAKTRLEVRGYQDQAQSTMDTVDRITKVVEIALRPTITVAAGTDVAKVEELFQKAHKYCIIANSITAKVVMEPKVVQA
jgi:organic hydroperoxide reductase OsmC/OhrA